MTIQELLNFGIFTLVVGIIAYVLIWAIAALGVPEPLGRIGRVAIAVIAVLSMG